MTGCDAEKVKLGNCPPGFDVSQLDGVPVLVEPSGKARMEEMFRDLARIPTSIDRKVRRVLSVGDSFGHFAAWCGKRWPLSWVDVLIQSLADIKCLENVPPGYGVIDLSEPTSDNPKMADYDVIRAGSAEWVPAIMGLHRVQFIGNGLMRLVVEATP